MAVYSTRVVTIRRCEYVLPSPVNWAEYEKARSAIKTAAESEGIDTSYDDAITIEARDDEIVLFYVIEHRGETT